MEVTRIPTSYTYSELAMKATVLIQLTQTYKSIRDKLGTFNESTLRKYINVDLKRVKIEYLEMTPKLTIFQEFLNDYFNDTKEFNELIIEAIKKENYVALLWIYSVQSRRILSMIEEIIEHSSSSSNLIFEWAISIYPLKIEKEMYNIILFNIVKKNLLKNLDLILKNHKFEDYNIIYDVIKISIEINNIEVFIWGIYKSSDKHLLTEILIESGYNNRTEFIKYISTYYIEEILENFSQNEEKYKKMLSYVNENGNIEVLEIMNIFYKEKIKELKIEELKIEELEFD